MRQTAGVNRGEREEIQPIERTKNRANKNQGVNNLFDESTKKTSSEDYFSFAVFLVKNLAASINIYLTLKVLRDSIIDTRCAFNSHVYV